jgi:predicted ArsR family transcriptional regulator
MFGDPDDLVAELATHVLDSFEKLEVVVQMASTRGPQPLAAIAANVKLGHDTVRDAMTELAADGVVEILADGYALLERGRWTAHVDALAEMYREDRMHVVTHMSEGAMRRLRMKTDRAFSDAFLIRWKKGDDDG